MQTIKPKYKNIITERVLLYIIIGVNCVFNGAKPDNLHVSKTNISATVKLEYEKIVKVLMRSYMYQVINSG